MGSRSFRRPGSKKGHRLPPRPLLKKTEIKPGKPVDLHFSYDTLTLLIMSARKITNPELFQPVVVQSQTQTRLDLPAGAVRIRKNGIEFQTDTAIPVWTEMTVAMQTPSDSRKVNFTGVVVACSGNRHSRYVVSLLFTNVSKQAQARLNSLSLAP